MTPTPRDKHREAIQGVAPSMDSEAVSAPLEQFEVQVLGPTQNPHPDDQAVMTGLENLLPRMFSQVGVLGRNPEQDEMPSFHRARIRRERLNDPDLSIVVGPDAPRPESPALFVGSEGWTPLLSRERVFTRERQDVRNPIAGLHAAALAAGEAFKTAYQEELSGIQPIEEPLRYDILRFQRTERPVHEPLIPQQLHIDQALLVGAGAIGQAFVTSIALLPEVTGSLRIVDPDQSDEGNIQRSMLAHRENQGVPKAQLCRNALVRNHGLLQIGIPTSAPKVMTDYQGYRSMTDGRIDEPLVVTAVDSAQARRDVQAGLPKVILDGWTEVQEGLLGYGIGRFTLDDPHGCLSCFHHPPDDEPEEADLAASVTPFSKEECQRRLDDHTIPTTREDLVEIANHTKRDFEEIRHLQGSPLEEILHAQDCGLARMRVDEEDVRAPVTHMPALVGTLLAAQFVVEVMEEREQTSLEHLASFDARWAPTDAQLSEREPSTECICQKSPFGSAYQEMWL